MRFKHDTVLAAVKAWPGGSGGMARWSDGRRGNPVLWSRRFFKELMTLDGDVGARHLIAKHAEAVAEVPVDGQSAFLDIDTPQALEAARGS